MNERIASSPPEAALIAAARERAGLSKRAAARKAGISDALWRRIEGGHMLERGAEGAVVVGPARRIAAMAAAVGVTPDELETAGRPDAAAELRKVAEQLAQEARVQLPPQLRDGFAALAGEIDAVLASIGSDPHFTRAQKRVLRDELAGRLMREAAEWRHQLDVMRSMTRGAS